VSGYVVDTIDEAVAPPPRAVESCRGRGGAAPTSKELVLGIRAWR
jgi:hypothetical protein